MYPRTVGNGRAILAGMGTVDRVIATSGGAAVCVAAAATIAATVGTGPWFWLCLGTALLCLLVPVGVWLWDRRRRRRQLVRTTESLRQITADLQRRLRAGQETLERLEHPPKP